MVVSRLCSYPYLTFFFFFHHLKFVIHYPRGCGVSVACLWSCLTQHHVCLMMLFLNPVICLLKCLFLLLLYPIKLFCIGSQGILFLHHFCNSIFMALLQKSSCQLFQIDSYLHQIILIKLYTWMDAPVKELPAGLVLLKGALLPPSKI